MDTLVNIARILLPLIAAGILFARWVDNIRHEVDDWPRARREAEGWKRSTVCSQCGGEMKWLRNLSREAVYDDRLASKTIEKEYRCSRCGHIEVINRHVTEETLPEADPGEIVKDGIVGAAIAGIGGGSSGSSSSSGGGGFR